MFFDSMLDWAVVAIPTVLGIAGWLVPITNSTLKHRFYLVIIGCGLSVLIFWQQSRSRSSHAVEVTHMQEEIRDLNTTVDGLHKTIDGLNGTIKDMKTAQETETARRQQAEKDMALIIQATGQQTRSGVAEDIRKAPLSVQLNGRPVAINQEKMNKLAEFVQTGNQVRNAVPRLGTGTNAVEAWLKSVDNWWNAAQQFLRSNCTPQAVVTGSNL